MSYRSTSDMSGPASPSGMSSRRLTNRNTNRYSVNQLYSMAAEQDPDVEDDLSRGKSRRGPEVPRPDADGVYSHFPAQKRLRELKSKISAQSKKNFVLERDVRYLDGRIALLIQNRMALDEVSGSRPGNLQTLGGSNRNLRAFLDVA
jgi:Ras GTPase-activating-like protein IQGAP2/3